jgi:hypothetical protein
MPGPTLLAQVAAAGAGATGAARARGIGPTACQLKTSAATRSGDQMRDPTHRS